MHMLYNQLAPKKPTNLSINSDLLKKTKVLDINLSATLEAALKDILTKRTKEQWRTENADAIKSYNKFVEDNGCFSDDFRSF